MINEEILKVIRDRGLLLEREVFELLKNFSDGNVAREFLEQIERVSGQKMITRNVLSKNFEYVKSFVGTLPSEDKNIVEKICVNLGISFEVRHEKEIIVESSTKNQNEKVDFIVVNSPTQNDKKLEVKDFTNCFRARFQQLQKFLMLREELNHNLVSIGKIGSDRNSFSIIGIVTEKRVTKNKNLILTLEDLTGEIKAIVRADKKDIFEKAEELQLDDVIGVKASGNKDMVFVHDIFYPDSIIFQKVKFEREICAAFISDIHCGSDRHLSKSFSNFLNWLNSEDETARKMKYIFIVGDNVDGVGIFPGQEEVLSLRKMEEQYSLLASYLKRVPKNITMFMCPGQHDAVRVAEPQPIIGKKYASEIYDIENLVLVTNPSLIKLIEGEREFKVMMYHGASIHTFINEIKELRESKAHKCPAKAVKHILKRRHLSPTHSEAIYIPNSEKDSLVISEVPDVFCTGEVHRLDIETYNNILIITGSCWQARTPFEEKIGNEPDPAKVPVLNLKTRELKVFDFGVEDEINRSYTKPI